jgi:hypothetical protein
VALFVHLFPVKIQQDTTAKTQGFSGETLGQGVGILNWTKQGNTVTLIYMT